MRNACYVSALPSVASRALVGLVRAWGVAALLGAVAGCSTSGRATPGAIGSEGGTVAVASGPLQGASVDVPAGAVASNVTITVSPVDGSGDSPPGSHEVGPVVRLGPEGQTFAVPVTVTLPTTATADSVYTRPSAGGTPWVLVPDAAYDAARRVITVHVAHFSDFVATAMDSDAGAGLDACAGSTCDGGCVDLQRDNTNCGACGHACGFQERCTQGMCCETAFGVPPILCGGRCTQPNDDPANCGGCGHVCPAYSNCVSPGECICDNPGPSGTCLPPPDGGASPDAATTDAGDGGCTASCDGGCVDLQRDNTNCGACGHACGFQERCTQGMCCETAFGVPPILCGGRCTQPNDDPANCGGCGHVCPAYSNCVSPGECICDNPGPSGTCLPPPDGG